MVGKSSIRAGVKAGRVRLCRVELEGNAVWSHKASDTP